MASQTLELSVKGVHTYSSELSGVPKGALLEANNVNINRINIIEPQRGFDFLPGNLPSPSDRVNKFIVFKKSLLAHAGGKLLSYAAGVWSDRGACNAIAGRKLPFAVGNQNLYVASDTGILKLDSLTGQLKPAGIPKAVHMIVSLSAGASGFLGASKFSAYSCVFGKIDANNNLVLGGVSQRSIIQNTTATASNVSLKISIPQGVEAGYFVQVYRVASSTTEPDQEYQLCYEYILQSADITAKSYTFIDNVPDSLLGAYLYTSNSQGGAANDYWSIPAAKDLCTYKSFLVLANVRYKHRLQVALIAVGNASGVIDGSEFKVTRGGVTYTYVARTTPNVALPREFKLSATGVTSVDIRDTALALVKAINEDLSTHVYAFYLSGARDLPGKIMLEARDINDSAFQVTSNRALAFNPNIPSTANIQTTSTSYEAKNCLAFSEEGQSEHIPLGNLLPAGRSDMGILRIVALQDAVLIFKEDGLFTLRGESKYDFRIEEVDTTAILLAPEGVTVANNVAFAFLDTGFSICTDGGVEGIVTPIKDEIEGLIGSIPEEIKAHAHAMAYQTVGKVYFWFPEVQGSTYATKAWIYDFFNRTFVSTDRPALSSLVFEDKILLGRPNDSRIHIERKTFTERDFADYAQDLTILVDNGIFLTLSSVAEMSAGDVLIQGSTYAYVRSINTALKIVELDIDMEWEIADTVAHLKAIVSRVTWNAAYADNPAGYKDWIEVIMLFKRSFLETAKVGFSTDLNPGVTYVEVQQTGGSGDFGDFDFGDASFGGDDEKSPLRVSPPRNASKSNLLYVTFESRVAFSEFQLNGVSLVFNPISTAAVR